MRISASSRPGSSSPAVARVGGDDDRPRVAASRRRPRRGRGRDRVTRRPVDTGFLRQGLGEEGGQGAHAVAGTAMVPSAKQRHTSRTYAADVTSSRSPSTPDRNGRRNWSTDRPVEARRRRSRGAPSLRVDPARPGCGGDLRRPRDEPSLGERTRPARRWRSARPGRGGATGCRTCAARRRRRGSPRPGRTGSRWSGRAPRWPAAPGGTVLSTWNPRSSRNPSMMSVATRPPGRSAASSTATSSRRRASTAASAQARRARRRRPPRRGRSWRGIAAESASPRLRCRNGYPVFSSWAGTARWPYNSSSSPIAPSTAFDRERPGRGATSAGARPRRGPS